jgi:hypothetical protein
MTVGVDPSGPAPAAPPVLALIDCGTDQAAARLASLEELALQLAATVRIEQVSAACTAMAVTLAPDVAQRFQAALLLGGATILAGDGAPATEFTILVTISARSARRE